MKPFFRLSFLLLVFVSAIQAWSQELSTGPVFQDFGLVYEVPNPDIPLDLNATYEVVFDISQGSDDPADLNRYFNTVARFLNMHVAAGVPLENLKPVLVVHGSAAFALLKNEFYQEKFGVDNPNLDLLNRLYNHDIPVILCGQTAALRNISIERRWRGSKLALSAMTALIHYQNLGYALISF